MLLLDNNFKRLDIDTIRKYMNMGFNNAILFVKRDQAKKVKREFRPQKIYPVRTSLIGEPDYLFTYSNSNIP